MIRIKLFERIVVGVVGTIMIDSPRKAQQAKKGYVWWPIVGRLDVRVRPLNLPMVMKGQCLIKQRLVGSKSKWIGGPIRPRFHGSQELSRSPQIGHLFVQEI